MLQDGSHIPADVVVWCMGFDPNARVCEQLTDCKEIKHSRYLAPQVMYLAAVEMDATVDAFCGYSELKMAKFHTDVFIRGLTQPEALAECLWGDPLPVSGTAELRWSQSVAQIAHLNRVSPAVAEVVAAHVHNQSEAVPPRRYTQWNKSEWEQLHAQLNGAVPVAPDQQLPYLFDDEDCSTQMNCPQ